MSKRYIKKKQMNKKEPTLQKYSYFQLLVALKYKQFDIENSKILDSNNILWCWNDDSQSLIKVDDHTLTFTYLSDQYDEFQLLDITFTVIPPKTCEIHKQKALQKVIENIEMLYIDLYMNLDSCQGCTSDCDAKLEMLKIYKDIVAELGSNIDDDFQLLSNKWYKDKEHQEQIKKDKDKVLEFMQIPLLDLVAMDDKQLSNHLLDIYNKINDICTLLRDKFTN